MRPETKKSEMKKTKVIKENRKISLQILRLMLPAALAAMLLSSCTDRNAAILEARDKAIEIYNSGDYAAAEKAFDEALQLGKGKVGELQYDILKYRGECEIRQGKYDEARDTYQSLKDTEGNEDNDRIYQQVLDEVALIDVIKEADEIIKEGRYKEAYKLLDEIDAPAGSSISQIALYNKAVCKEYLHEYEEAYTLFQQYLASSPDDEDARKEAAFLSTR